MTYISHTHYKLTKNTDATTPIIVASNNTSVIQFALSNTILIYILMYIKNIIYAEIIRLSSKELRF